MTLDPLTFIFEIVNFLVLLWLLKRFLYKPVQQAIVQRQQMAAQALTAAIAREKAAAAALAAHAKAQQDWQAEMSTRQNALHKELAEERENTMATIQAAAQVEKQRLQTLAEQEQTRRAAAMQEEATTQALKMSRQFLQRCAGETLDGLLLNIFQEDLAKVPAAQQELLRAAFTSAGAVKISSARALSNTQQAALTKQLQDFLGNEPHCTYVIRADLISGVRIEIGAHVLHVNLADELAFFHTGLMHV